MKKNVIGFLLLGFILLGTSAVAQTQQQRLEKHVYYLAADSLNGRKAGSPDARKALNYIENEYRSMGLQPLWGDNMRRYFVDNQSSPLPSRSRMTPVSPDSVVCLERRDRTVFCNLVAVIPGSDPVLKNEYIVVGAHYDHLGIRNGEVYNGADDNASGSAAVIELARQLMLHRDQLDRSVILCAFDAEEIGLWGSSALAQEMSDRGLLDHVTLMMSIDMVGWLKDGKLDFSGTATLKGGSDLLAAAQKKCPIDIKTHGFETSPFGATDTEPFAKRNVPTLAVTTGLRSPYHKPEDDADLIDYAGLSKVTDYLSTLVATMASAETAMTPTGRIASKHKDRLPVLQGGIQLGVGSSFFNFSESAFQTKAGFSGQIGLTGQLNVTQHVGLQVDVLLDRFMTDFPRPATLLSGSLEYAQTSLMVPAQLKLIMGDRSFNFQLGLGGFYSHLLRSSLTDPEIDAVDYGRILPTQQYGLVWSLSMHLMEKLTYGVTCYYAFNGYNSLLDTDTKRRSVLAHFGYQF